MKVISPKVDLVKYDSETSLMEKVGRVSYKSEDKITETSSEDFLKRMQVIGLYLSSELSFLHYR